MVVPDFPELPTRDVVRPAPSPENYANEPPCPSADGRYQCTADPIKGANSLIYLAWDRDYQQDVAIKRLNSEYRTRPHAAEQFENASRRMLRIGPIPGIAAHKAVEHDEHGPYLVMQRITGKTLMELVKSRGRPLSPLTCVRIFEQLCRAMQAIHENRILHCDLKPGNLMVDLQQTAWVIDFGTAIAAASNDVTTSAVSGWDVGGSDDYLPQERLATPPEVEIRSDIYSLGLCLRYALTGLAPTEHPQHQLPRQLQRIVAKATAVAADDRFRSMAEFADSLKRAGVCLQARRLLCGAAVPLTLLLGGLNAWSQAGYPGLEHLRPIRPAAAASTTDRHPEHPGPVNRVTPAQTPTDPHTLNMRRIQQDEAQRLGVAVTFTNSQQQTFLLIPARISQGTEKNPGESADETVQQRQQVLEPVYMQTHEVSRGQFDEFVRQTGYRTEAETNGRGGWGLNSSTGQIEFGSQYTWRNPGFSQTDDHPVVLVSELDIAAYSQWLSRQDNRTYRLPTETEWFHARRAGTHTRFWTGDDRHLLTAAENICDSAARQQFPDWAGVSASDGWAFTAPTGVLRANPFGLHDLVGNVAEYCCDHTTLRPGENNARERQTVTAGRSAARLNGESFLGAPQAAQDSISNRKDPRIHCAAGFRLLCEIPTD
ncbi:MAG: bifunctional serine/threonine-protein kinase/formylglycine-generating enzyme family protein [Planctomyces sp.]|jgi:formylglycine-generating enzyme required for sulfatase activity/tRNA A-37 threonylcarbamoyl transferase component Bud32